jgi:hypothetical protein
LGKRLGVDVIWLRATKFPLEIWVWGLAGRRHGRSRLDSRIALASVAICLAGAFMPTAALCLLLHWSPSDQLGPALYLTTPLILPVFVASHLKWRASDSLSNALRATAGRHDEAPPPSEPPGRLDSSKEGLKKL